MPPFSPSPELRLLSELSRVVELLAQNLPGEAKFKLTELIEQLPAGKASLAQPDFTRTASVPFTVIQQARTHILLGDSVQAAYLLSGACRELWAKIDVFPPPVPKAVTGGAETGGRDVNAALSRRLC